MFSNIVKRWRNSQYFLKDNPIRQFVIIAFELDTIFRFLFYSVTVLVQKQLLFSFKTIINVRIGGSAALI